MYNNHSYNFRERDRDNGTDVYVMSGAYKSPSQFSGGGPTETPAPTSCCLGIRGTCCLMVLVNLVVIVSILGFLIVFLIPFFDPIYLWIFGIIFSVFGLLTIVVTVRVHMRVQGQQIDLGWLNCCC